MTAGASHRLGVTVTRDPASAQSSRQAAGGSERALTGRLTGRLGASGTAAAWAAGRRSGLTPGPRATASDSQHARRVPIVNN